ncbi:hypothetical protein D3M96_14440 [Alcaligenes aquatilis]|uniref:Uncharacterized protein n=1 Tax=Alcaligenes aquatilis TaxID=323284 RepID=A0A3G2HX24_9BURK|nr:hypothetical protein D3M96_14440 [Alcaligenes aquatilis]
MKLLCRLLGHKPDPWFHLPSHPEIGPPYYDGVIRAHRDLRVQCQRCNSMYTLGKVIDPLLSGQAGMDFYDQRRKEQASDRHPLRY